MQWRATQAATLGIADDTLSEGTESLTVRTLAGTLPLGSNVTVPPDRTIAIIDDEPVAGAPRVHAVAITSDAGPDATYAAGETIEATVILDQPVTVTGTPQLTLNLGGSDRTADYRSGTGVALRFGYTVADGESDTVGVGIEANSLSLNSGTIRDGSDNDAVLGHEEVAADWLHRVDGVKPVLASTGGATVTGDTLTLTYQEALDRSSTPLAGNLGVTVEGERRNVAAVEVGGSTVGLSLSSAVEAGEAVTVSYSAGTGPGAKTIRDVAGNDASGFMEQTVTNRTGETGDRGGEALPLRTMRQIETLLARKAQRTPAQRKVSSRLLDAGNEPPAQASAEAPGDTPQMAVRQELVTVDIRADVTPAVLARIEALGGTVVNSVPKYRAIRARLPRTAVEPLATLEAVQFIRPADQPITNQVLDRSTVAQAVVGLGKVDTTEGDVAHKANVARQTYSVDGTGIGIGVISDGVDTLAEQQLTGDLPARVTVLAGQGGGSWPYACEASTTGTEGTAMLEIVHDLAPGADLFFATAAGGPAQMAQNIEDLCAAGADVIVDDIGFFGTSVFQDDVVSQAISAAAANGCYYFSSAGNFGNLNDGTAGVWEGDFAAGSAPDLRGFSDAVVHDFGGGVTANRIDRESNLPIVLQWADPVGGSANDYDLLLINADNQVVAWSTTTQDGTQDPIEFIPSSCLADREGTRIVIVKKAGAADRYLRLTYMRGGLAVATAGAVFGHAASQDAIGVAAVDVADAGGAGGVFNGTESVERFSSDGPRRIFFEADGTPITPRNFSSSGGRVLQKPDLAAADGVSTSTPGFSPFYGTSAAAPHAAGIAALLLEAAGGPANVTSAALRTALTGASLDIEESGVDRDSGAGIVMAPGAVDAVDVAEADRNEAPTVENSVVNQEFAPGAAAVTIDLANVFGDPDNDTLTYSVWSSDDARLSVGSLTGTAFTLTPLAPGRMAVTVVATDPEGLSAVLTFDVTVTAGNHDYDVDNDGLIDVGNLAQLDAMRYDLNGDGLVDRPSSWTQYHAAAFVEGSWDMGCPDRCIGYELTADLDFDTNASGSADVEDAYWNGGDGWVPVGDVFNSFSATFDGDGHTVSNLFIESVNASSYYPAGLFGVIRDCVVRDVGLLDVAVSGNWGAGGLVGYSIDGTISDSYVTGRVSGKHSVGGLAGRSGERVTGYESGAAITASHSNAQVSGREYVGGLVGVNTDISDITASYATGHVSGIRDVIGGLVGLNIGTITASHATGQVEGRENVGGLVGQAGGTITASHATGNVDGAENVGGLVGLLAGDITATYATGQVEGGENAGGLAGYSQGEIHASYATSLVGGDENIGGLVGSAHPGAKQVVSYWDIRTSGHSVGTGGRTTTELQAPTDYGGIYQAWNLDLDGDTEPDNPWDFGSSAQYPVLAADVDGNGEATWQEFGYQLRAGPVLTASTDVGQAVVLTWSVVDTSPWSPAPEVTYTLIRDDGDAVKILAPDLAGLQYTDTTVTADATYTYQVAAVLDGGEAARSALVEVIAGVANQPPLVVMGTLPDRTLQVGTTEVVEVAGAFSDLDDTLTYAALSSDVAVATVSVSGAQVTMTPVAPGRTTITVTATDTGGSNTSVTQRFQVAVWTGTGVDYDADNDGLIEIATLAQLDAVRHDLDGDGVPVQSGMVAYSMAFPVAATGMGCPSGGGCTGYELETDLDFDTNGDGRVDAGDQYWEYGAGWEPIGVVGFAFRATFEGNGHAVRHLYSRAFSGGLFGGNFGVIRRVAMIDVDVSGGSFVGGLVAQNGGEIHSSYVTGRVAGDSRVGGLVGQSTGSLARARITASYSTARVSGTDKWVGGLVGFNSGPVSASYATGRISGGDDVGGLIGCHLGSAVVASYATGIVSGGSNVGGLIGSTECSSSSGSVTTSYWDSGTSGQASGTGARTTAQLQAPTGYSDIYSQWNVDLDNNGTNDNPWHFGSSAQYPALAADMDGNGEATWQEFGHQLRAGPTLTGENTARPTQVDLSWTAVDVSHWHVSPGVTYTVTRAEGVTVNVLAKNISERQYTDPKARTGPTYTYQVAAVVDGGEATRSARVTVTAGTSPQPGISITAGPGPVTEGATATFTLTRTGPTTEALAVAVSVTESGAMLAPNPPGSVTFGAGESSATLTVATDDDAVVEAASAVTAAVANAGSAQVSVEDNDAPIWDVSPSAVEIAEGDTATLTVSAGAVTFAEAQVLELRTAGTADAVDYALSPPVPQIPAGSGSVAVSVTAVDDAAEEEAETVRLTVLHGGGEVGTATVTIAANDAGTTDATLADLTLSGGEFAFRSEVERYAMAVHKGVESTTVTAKANDPDAAVDVSPADTDSDPANGHQVRLAEGANAVVVTVVSEDGQATKTYTVTVTRLARDRAEALRRPERDLDDLSGNVPFGLWSEDGTLWSAMWWSVGLVAFDLETHGRLTGRDIAVASDNASPTGLWSDGATLWASDYGGGVYAYRLADGERVPGEDLAATLEEAGNDTPTGLWSDGTTLWVADHYDERVYAYRLADKARDEDREFALGEGTRAFGLWSDGTTVWTADLSDGRVAAYRLADGSRDADRDYDTSTVGNEAPVSLWSDGETLWVGDRYDEKLYAYALEAAASAASADATLASLALSGVNIGAFDAATTDYAAAVGPAVASTTVTATPASTGASVTIADSDGSTTDGPRDVSLAVGANTVTVTVTAADGHTRATYTVAVTRAYPLPTASIAAGTSPVTEGTAAAFTLTRTGPTTAVLAVAVSVTESGAMLAANPPASVTFGIGETSATLTVATDDDAVVEGAGAVTAAIASGEGYAASAAAGSAQVSVEDNDTATFEVSFDAEAIAEGQAATLTVEIANGVTFAGDQTIALDFAGGTATKGTDYTVSPESLALAAGSASVQATVTAVDDADPEGAETVAVAARHEGAAIGSASLTIEASDAALPEISMAAGTSPVTEGTAATFTLTRTGPTTETLTVAVSVTESGAMLAANPPSSVTFGEGQGSATLTVGTDDDAVVEAASAVTAAVASGEGYAAAANAGSAQVTVEDNDEPSWEVSPSAVEIAEGETATLTVSAGAVTFAEAQVLVIGTAGTADASDYTLSPAAPQLPAGAGSVAVSVTAVDDATEEEAEALRLTVLHGGVEAGTATVTIAASDAGTGDATPAERAEALRRAERDLDDLSGNVPFGLWSEDGTLWSAMWWSVGLVAFDLETHGRLTGRDIAVASDNASPTGLWSDGATLWASDYGGGVYAYRLADGERVPGEDLAATLEEAGNDTPTGLWSDGTTLWVADHYDERVYAYRLADKARDEDREFALGEGTRAFGLWSDGTTVWTADLSDGRVAAYRLADGSRDADRDYDTSTVGNEAPVSLWSDGETLWVGDRYDEKLYAYALEAEASAEASLASLALSGVNIGAFDAATTDYAAAVGPAVASTTVTATPASADASVTVSDRDGSTTDGPREVSLAVGANTITATVMAADGQTTATYTVTVTRAHATPTFTVTAGQGMIQEGASTPVTVAIANGVTFAADQTITLSVSGTAVAADYTLDSTTLTLGAGESEVTGTLTAVDDEAEEQEETVTVAAAHNGSTVGTATVTIAANDVPLSNDATLSALTLSGIDIGTFAPATTAYAATVAEAASSTTLTATPNEADASVTIADEGGSTDGGSREVSLSYGANAITATVTAADGRTTATYTVTVTREYTAPTASIASGTTPVTEGVAAVFTVSLDKPAAEALTVSVTVSETGDALAGPASSVALAPGERSAALILATANDSVVEAASTVTAALAAADGYSVGPQDSASVVVEDDDAATFAVSAGQATIEEGGSTAVTVAIANGATFAADQTITLSAAGTAVAADYTLDPTTLTLGAGESEAATTLTAVDDEGEEQDETVTVSATHEGASIGTATVTIAANDAVASADASLSGLTLSGIDIGAFVPETTDYVVSVGAEISSTTVSASARDAGASVSITDAQGSTAGATREVALAAGANTITVTVMAADGQATRTYTVTVTRAQAPLTATFHGVPETHDGATEFTFELRFSEELGLSFRTLRDEGAFAVTGGRVLRARRSAQGSNRRWTVAVLPATRTDVVATLRGGRPCDETGAICASGERQLANSPSATVAGPDSGMSTVSITADAGAVPEGAAAAFTLTRTGDAQDALTVSVSVTESGAMAAGNLPGSATFAPGGSTAALAVPTSDDAVVEADSAVTAALAAATGYSVGPQDSASVVVEDDDAATFAVAAGQTTIEEGGSTAVTVAIANGVTFAADQAIALSAAGTAAAADYTLDPTTLTLGAGESEVATTLTAVDDEGEEQDETVTVSATHEGSSVGTATVTIAANDAPLSADATLSGLALSGIDIGTFESGTKAYAATVAEAVSSTTATATPNDTDASVTIADPGGSTEGTSRTTSLAAGETRITITVTAADGQATATYTVTVTREYTAPTASIAAGTTPVTEGAAAVFTVSLDKPAAEALTVSVSVSETGDALAGTASSVAFAAGERSATLNLATSDDAVVEADSAVTAALAAATGYSVGPQDSASVVVEDDDAATFAVAAGQTTIEEGGSTAVTVAIANGVTFAADQAIALSAAGTAAAADYTLDPTTLTLGAGESEVATTLTAVDDEGEEQDETVTVSATHEGSSVGTATVTIAANDTPLSADATLSALTLSGIEIGTFDPATTDYAADVGNEVESTTVTATPNDDGAAVVITDSQGSTAGTTRTTQLDEGANAIGVAVTAADSIAARRYAVTVTRAAAAESPAWGERLPEKDIELSAADRPRGLWSDGETLWAGDWDNGRVVAYALADGSRAPSRDFALGSYLATALFSDGATLWAADYAGGVYAYRLADGERRADDDLDAEAMAEAGNDRPAGLWSDGDTMWVADHSDGHVYAYALADGSRQSGKEFSLRGDGLESMRPLGLWSDGETVLATNWIRGTVRGYALADGARQSGHDIDEQATGNDYAAGLWSDGATLWVVDEFAQKAYAYAVPGLRKPTKRGSLLQELASRATVVPGGTAAGPPVSIPDAALRGRIAAALGRGAADLAGVDELAALVVLDARGAGVADLTGLEHAVNLEGLDLGDNAVGDLRPLASLPKLRRLNVDGAVARLWQLRSLRGLTELSLRDNDIEDLSALASLTGLAALDVGGNRIDDLGPLSGLVRLRALDIRDNRVANLSPLGGLDSLSVVDVTGNRIADFSALSARDGPRIVGRGEQHGRH